MAQQIIDIGSAANDGTGDTLRDAMIKAKSNFDELYVIDPAIVQKLYNTAGFGFYVQEQTTPSTQVITTTPTLLEIDVLGATSTSAYLPLEIRGISELWDTTNNKITPISIGDGYTMRIDLEITAKTGNPNGLDISLDIGGGATPTNVFIERVVSTLKATPYRVSVAFPFYSLSDFKTNGGQIFLKTDTGTLTITNRQISIHRISNGAL